jgi:hypothetical protein
MSDDHCPKEADKQPIILARPMPHRLRRPLRAEALTDDRITTIYQPLINWLRSFMPAEARRLEDLLHRIAFNHARESLVREEEECKLAQQKERTLESNQWIDNEIQGILQQIADCRSCISQAHQEYEQQLQPHEDALLEAREEEWRLAAQCGMIVVSNEETPTQTENAPPAAQPSPTETVPALNASPQQPEQRSESTAPPRTSIFATVRDALANKIAHRLESSPTPEPKPWHWEPDYSESLALARKRAPSVEALAARYGILSHSPTMELMQGMRLKPVPEDRRGLFAWAQRLYVTCANAVLSSSHWLMTAVATVTCGTIFGASIGILLGIVQMDQFTVDPQAQLRALGPLAVIGVAMFWILGRTVHGIAALLAEERYNSFIIRHQGNPERVGKWLRIAAFLSLIVLGFTLICFIVLEATIERNGIVRFFQDRSTNQLILTGSKLASGGISKPTAWTLALVASVPFLFWHALEGWVYGRGHSIYKAFADMREVQVYDIADEIHQEHTHMARAQAAQQQTEVSNDENIPASTPSLDDRVNEASAQPTYGTANGLYTPIDSAASQEDDKQPTYAVVYQKAQNQSQSSELGSTSSPTKVENAYSTDTPGSAESDNDTTEPHQDEAFQEKLGEYAAALQRSKTLYERFQRIEASLRQQRDDTIQGYQRQIERLDNRLQQLYSQIKQPPQSLSPESQDRIGVAYLDYNAAIRCFDRHFYRLLWRIRVRLAGGYIRYLLSFLWCMPIAPPADDTALNALPVEPAKELPKVEDQAT